MIRRVHFLAAAALATFGAVTWALADRLEDTFYIPLDHPAIHYARESGDSRIARLEKDLESGRVKLDYAPNGLGYLPSVLKHLDINPDSQVLVFSKTSIQSDKISPLTPRALYFNDDSAVGHVQKGDLLELTSVDPTQAVIFYTMDAEKSSQPEFDRRDDCLRCHQGAHTLGVPGLMISSIHPASEERREHGSAFVTDDRTPLEERWGGWYVTGITGSQKHLGNNTALVDPIHPGGPAGPASQNLTSLSELFATSRYLEPTSDVVALMTLEHQIRMTNLMTRIGWDVRIAISDGKMDDEATRKQIDSEIDEMVAYMLFEDEAPLKEPVRGVSSFSKTFPERGPRDRQGRSLRDFNLKTRLFEYPLSYMIYTAAFDGMPALVRERVYRRVYDKLTKRNTAEARAILQIVRETKQGLPAYWTAQ